MLQICYKHSAPSSGNLLSLHKKNAQQVNLTPGPLEAVTLEPQANLKNLYSKSTIKNHYINLPYLPLYFILPNFILSEHANCCQKVLDMRKICSDSKSIVAVLRR